MTLGGLALAVGILVDDATVTIENINWHLEHGKDVRTAILDGARQIVQPAFVSLLCICIVFVPMLALRRRRGLSLRADGDERGVRHDRLVHAVAHPGADACRFICSSRISTAPMTPSRRSRHAPGQGGHFFARLQRRFEGGFRSRPRVLSQSAGAGARPSQACSSSASWLPCWSPSCCFPSWVRTSFPSVDTGQITLHVRPPVGTRLEDTTQQIAAIEAEIRHIIPGARSLGHRRQPGHSPQRDQPDLQQHRHHRHLGHRHLHQSDRRSSRPPPAM